MHRVATPARQFGRQSKNVQLELTLPGTADSIWARGQIRYDDLGMDLVALLLFRERRPVTPRSMRRQGCWAGGC